jgi:hypothetical protein
MVNVRQPSGVKPKYLVFKGSSRGGIYPDAKAVEPGKPLVIVERELDALLLGQELAGIASVVTLDSASDKPEPPILRRIFCASRWYVATDADAAGDTCAAGWSSATRRVRPPGPHKDWTDAHLGGVNLRRWWSEILTGNPSPVLYT